MIIKDYNGNAIEVPEEFENCREHIELFQNAQLVTLRRFAKVCDEHGLRYYIASGNALGAARHGGFIPWDDDVDVIVPRPDYDRLEKMLIGGETNLHAYSYMEIPDFLMANMKVGPREIENLHRSPYAIDVFAMDILPKSRVVRWLQKKINTLLRLILSCRYGCHDAPVPKWQYCLYLFVGWLFPHDNFKINRIRRSLSRMTGAFAPTTLVGGRFSQYGDKEFMPFEIYGVNGGKDVLFCGEKFKAPAQLESYLSHFFGDWKDLPPFEKRIPRHFNDPNWFWSDRVPMAEQKLIEGLE